MPLDATRVVSNVPRSWQRWKHVPTAVRTRGDLRHVQLTVFEPPCPMHCGYRRLVAALVPRIVSTGHGAWRTTW